MKLVRDSQQISATRLRPVEEYDKEILATEEKLIQIQDSLQKKHQDVERLQAVNSTLIENNLGTKPRASVQAQQRFLLEARETIAGYARVQQELKSRLDTLLQEKALAVLHAELSPAFSKAEDLFTEQTKALFQSILDTNKVLEQLHIRIQEYLLCPADHLRVLKTMQDKLPGLDHRCFLEGEILPVAPAVNASFAQDVTQVFYQLSNNVPALGDLAADMRELQSKLIALSGVASSLVPRSARFIETPKPAKKGPPSDPPPKEYIEIQGRVFKFDPYADPPRYMPARTPKRRDPGFGVVSA